MAHCAFSLVYADNKDTSSDSNERANSARQVNEFIEEVRRVSAEMGGSYFSKKPYIGRRFRCWESADTAYPKIICRDKLISLDMDWDAETPEMTSGDIVLSFADESKVNLMDHMSVDCAYRELHQEDFKNKPSKKEKIKRQKEWRKRAILEELYRAVEGLDPKCFSYKTLVREEIPIPKGELFPDLLAEIKRSVEPGQVCDIGSLKIQRFRPPSLKKKDVPVILAVTPVEKTNSRAKKIALREKRREQLGLKPTDRTELPKNLAQAIAEATKPDPQAPPPKKLDVCIGVDVSGSMLDNIQDLHNQFGDLQARWARDYPDGVNVHVVEFGQDAGDKFIPRPRPDVKDVPSFKSYAQTFKADGGGIEPLYDAIQYCTGKLGKLEPEVQRNIIVISDEPDEPKNVLPLGVKPEDVNAEKIKAQYTAKLELVNPDDIAEPKCDPCGKTGDILARVEDCKRVMGEDAVKSAKGVSWSLVSCSDSKKAVWRDEATNLFWGDAIDRVRHYDAIEYAKDSSGREDQKKMIQKTCIADSTLEVRGGLKELSWVLPSKEDFELAETHEIRDVLPSMKQHKFWSSSLYSENEERAWVFSDITVRFYYFRGNHYVSVWCVGR